MLARAFRRDAALRGAIEEAELQEVRLVHVLDGLDLLADDRRNGSSANGAGGEFLDDGSEQSAIRRVEPLVDLERPSRSWRPLLPGVDWPSDLTWA